MVFLLISIVFVLVWTGVVSSVSMEVIQQAPFLPLTKSLLETISALNNSQLTATKQSIAEHLAKTYQYVHVPKLNVIHDCLGILIKEERIHHTDNGYFVTPKEDGGAHESKDCLLYTSPSPRDLSTSRMPSSA